MAATATLPDLQDIASHLQRSDDGIWFAAEREPVSYVDEGNATCFELEENSFWFRHRNDCIADLVRRFPPAGTIYDIGGGNGCVARHLIDVGFETALIEPGETGARNAARRGISTVICSTLSSARWRDESLPAAGLFDVLEHIEEDAAFLGELHRSLQPRARLYLTVPAYSWLWSDDDLVAGHARRHTLERLISCLAASSFRTLYSTYFFSLLPLPIFALRSVPSLFGRRRLPRHAYGSLHRQRASFLTDPIWAWEKRTIACGGAIPFGSSCLLVAEKC